MFESLFLALTLIALAIIVLTWSHRTFGMFGLIGVFLLIFLGFALIADGIDRVVSIDSNSTQLDANSYSDITTFHYKAINATDSQMYNWLSWAYILGGVAIGFLIIYNSMFARV